MPSRNLPRQLPKNQQMDQTAAKDVGSENLTKKPFTNNRLKTSEKNDIKP
ncbi:hypothetical protein PT276_10495 [Orbaceae bacterium ESL0721]|nr:hypothetical protein [Orbaceae bacterium ESL0721]